MMRTTLYSVIGKETTEKQKQNRIQQLSWYHTCLIYHRFLKNKKIKIVDQLKTLSDVMFVVIEFAHFFIYLLASEMRQYFGIGTNNNLFTVLYKENVFDENFCNLGKRLFPLGQNRVVISSRLLMWTYRH